MLTHPLLPKLRELKLSGMLETLEARTQLAQETPLSPTEFLALGNAKQLTLRFFASDEVKPDPNPKQILLRVA